MRQMDEELVAEEEEGGGREREMKEKGEEGRGRERERGLSTEHRERRRVGLCLNREVVVMGSGLQFPLGSRTCVHF